MSIEQLIILLVALILVTVIFYISGAIVGGDWSISGSYVLRMVIVALIAVIVIPLFRSAADQLSLGDLGLLLAFVILIVSVRFVMVDELTVNDEWLAAIVIALVGVVLIYIVDAAADALLDTRLLSLF
jgi:predicted ABC-type exoprotein transport system permease subunit